MLSIKSSALRIFSFLAHVLHRSQEGRSLNNKSLGWVDFLTPYHLSLNSRLGQIEVRKRNWFGIGVDSKILNFGQVRNILVDEHIITASIEIRVFAGNISAHWLRKSDAGRFKEQLMTLKRKPDSVGMFLE